MVKLNFPCSRWIVPRYTPAKKLKRADKKHVIYNEQISESFFAKEYPNNYDRYERCGGELNLDIQIVRDFGGFWPEHEIEITFHCTVCGEYQANLGPLTSEDALEVLVAEALNQRHILERRQI